MNRPVRSVRIPPPVPPAPVPLSPAQHPNTDNKVRPILPRTCSALSLIPVQRADRHTCPRHFAGATSGLPASPLLPGRERASSAARPSIKFTFKAMEREGSAPRESPDPHAVAASVPTASHAPASTTSADADAQGEDDDGEYELAGAMDVDPVLEELARWESDNAASTATSDELAMSSAIQLDSPPRELTQSDLMVVDEPQPQQVAQLQPNLTSDQAQLLAQPRAQLMHQAAQASQHAALAQQGQADSQPPSELVAAPGAVEPSLVVADPGLPGHSNGTSTEVDLYGVDETEWQDPAVLIPVPDTLPSPSHASHAESAANPAALVREPTPPATLQPALDNGQHPPPVASFAADVASSSTALDSSAILDSADPLPDLPNSSRDLKTAEPFELSVVEAAADEPTRSRSATAEAEPPSPSPSPSHSASTTTIDSSPLIITSLNALEPPPPLSLLNAPESEQEPASERSDRSPSPPLVIERAPSRQQPAVEPVSQPSAAASPTPDAGLEADASPVALACTDSPPPMSAAEGDVFMDIAEADLLTSSASGLITPFADSSAIQPEQPGTHDAAESVQQSPAPYPFSLSNLLNDDSPPSSAPPPSASNGRSHAPDQPLTNGSHPAPPTEPVAKPPLAFAPAQSRPKFATSSSFSAPHMPTPAAAAPKPVAPPRAATLPSASLEAPSLVTKAPVSPSKSSSGSTSLPPLAPVPHYGLVLPRAPSALSAESQRSLPLIYVAEHLPCSFMRTLLSDDTDAAPVSDYAYHATADEYALSLAEQQRKGKGRAVDMAGGYAGRPWTAYGFGPLPKKPPPVEGEREDSPPLIPAVLDKRKKEYRDMMLAKKAHEAKAAAGGATPKGTPVPKDKAVEKEAPKPPKQPAVRVKIPTRFKKAISACASFPSLDSP